MIELHWLFWSMVLLFGIVGLMRGWSREVIALAGLILSLFALNTFGWTLVRILGGVSPEQAQTDIVGAMKKQFYILSAIHLGIAFFSYQGVALVTTRLSRREKLQDRLLGLIVGSVNGYLIFGTMWSLLEYQFTGEGLIRLSENFPYAFDPSITRPVVESAGLQIVVAHLPMPFLSPWLPLLVVAAFLFVIVVII